MKESGGEDEFWASLSEGGWGGVSSEWGQMKEVGGGGVSESRGSLSVKCESKQKQNWAIQTNFESDILGEIFAFS